MRAYVILIASVICSPIVAQEKPPIPYYDWGACPFECCTYREWEATKQLDVHRQRDEKTPIAFHLSIGEKVTGLNGVVITRRYGVTRALEAINVGDPPVSLRPGEAVYTLHYVGEGYDLFWYHGKTYSDQISQPEGVFGDPPVDSSLKVESRPKTEWWVKLQSPSGTIGWSNQTDAFAHMDACE